MAYAAGADSRDYAIAYEIHPSDELPPDFQASSNLAGFRAAVFLPRDDPDWFGRSRQPPRLLALIEDRLAILPHPSSKEQIQRLGLEQICFIEAGHLLLKGWIRFGGAGFDRTLFYNRRDARPVESFLLKFKASFLGKGPGSEGIRVDLGDPLDIKFSRALSEELGADEVVRAVLFRPVRESISKLPFLGRRRRRAADLIAITNRRVLWITDLHGGFYTYYGSITRYVPCGNVTRIRRVRDGQKLILRLDLRCSEQPWEIPLAEEHYQAASYFENVLG